MIQKIFSIYDHAAQAFNAPFYFIAEGEAMRAFKQEVFNPESLINNHPHDYELYMLGKFDNISGQFEVEKKSLGTAASYKVDQHNVEILFPEDKKEETA